MTALPTLSVAGTPVPAPPVSLLSSNTASGHRPPQLADADWLRRRYEVDGDNAIAAHLGVSRYTVRRARISLGIVARPRGGQAGDRGRAYRTMRVRPVKSAAMQIGERISEESAPGGPPPTISSIAPKVRSLHEADVARDQPAIKDALISLASACGLALDHLQRLETR